jgi:molybdopterin biosynthesis enzyme
MLGADGFAIVTAGEGDAAAGAEVEVELLDT